VQLTPTSETEFTLVVQGDVQVTFERDAAGNTTAMVIRQSGREMRAEKVKQ